MANERHGLGGFLERIFFPTRAAMRRRSDEILPAYALELGIELEQNGKPRRLKDVVEECVSEIPTETPIPALARMRGAH